MLIKSLSIEKSKLGAALAVRAQRMACLYCALSKSGKKPCSTLWVCQTLKVRRVSSPKITLQVGGALKYLYGFNHQNLETCEPIDFCTWAPCIFGPSCSSICIPCHDFNRLGYISKYRTLGRGCASLPKRVSLFMRGWG